jgi:hypothetical protein
MDRAEAKSSCNLLAELVYQGPGHNPELLGRARTIIRRLQSISNSRPVHERALYALCSFEEWFSSTRWRQYDATGEQLRTRLLTEINQLLDAIEKAAFRQGGDPSPEQ